MELEKYLTLTVEEEFEIAKTKMHLESLSHDLLLHLAKEMFELNVRQQKLIKHLIMKVAKYE